MRIHSWGSGEVQPSIGAEAGGIHPGTWELLHLTSGTARLEWSHRSCTAAAPALYLLKPGTPHRLTAVEGTVSYRYLIYDSDTEDAGSDSSGRLTVQRIPDPEIAERWNASQSCRKSTSNNLLYGKLMETLAFIFDLLDSDSFITELPLRVLCDLELQKANLLIHCLVDRDKSSSDLQSAGEKWEKAYGVKGSDEAVERMKDYMECRYREQVAVSALARLVHLDSSYAIRIFREKVGLTPTQYLLKLRMKAAASYLSGSDLPIRRVAELAGFNSIHYFTRMFRKTYGDSPASWRAGLKR